MDSMSFNFTMEETKPIFTTASDTKSTVTTESYSPIDNANTPSTQSSVFSPLAPSFQSHGGNENIMLNLLPQEPRTADIAPPTTDIDDMLMNLRLNGNDLMFDDVDQNQHYYMGGNRPESVTSSHNSPWGEGSVHASRNDEMIDTFDFLIKSVSSADNFVSTMTREQVAVLRGIRPSLLYEFLMEVARVRGDKRLRRALPNECAFCKNNGENEECYSSHALKDWRGRVLCPVLRAFRCPRCGATGDRAHTIKYCPANMDSERSSLSSRRRVPPSLLFGQQHNIVGNTLGMGGAHTAPATPAPSPSPASAGLSQSSFWSSFGMNNI